jgi:hypothetical protein
MAPYWKAIFNALPVVMGALVGGICTFLGSYYLSRRTAKSELRNLSKALDIDISNFDIYISPYYGFYHLNSFPVENSLVIPPDPFYDTENGLYFSFNHDISRFDYDLSAELYQFYNEIFMLERDRRFVYSFWNSPDNNLKIQSEMKFLRMRALIKYYHEKRIPTLRKRLKSVFGGMVEEGTILTQRFDQA